MKSTFTYLLTLSSLVLSIPAIAEPTLTLDPAVIEKAKRAVFGGEALCTPNEEKKSAAEQAEQTPAQQWQCAMDAAGTEHFPVRLLALLQELNPEKPMTQHMEAYAEALRLHTLAAAGNKQACASLADSLITGYLPCGLKLFFDMELSAKTRR
jgi:hypothetical protein